MIVADILKEARSRCHTELPGGPGLVACKYRFLSLHGAKKLAFWDMPGATATLGVAGVRALPLCGWQCPPWTV